MVMLLDVHPEEPERTMGWLAILLPVALTIILNFMEFAPFEQGYASMFSTAVL